MKSLADTARRVPTKYTEHLAICAQLDQPDGFHDFGSFCFCTMLFQRRVQRSFPRCVPFSTENTTRFPHAFPQMLKTQPVETPKKPPKSREFQRFSGCFPQGAVEKIVESGESFSTGT
ncbi:hypothetical protein [uncultured Ruminococcus sp.]|uniref:hypothetical protein n=1 Tax=uncultured Ruminococcus sp. TaxID=165186 RepID=UPI00266BD7DC|nr:hypothetical protein [uncultured Ruminococcus sp.]